MCAHACDRFCGGLGDAGEPGQRLGRDREAESLEVVVQLSQGAGPVMTAVTPDWAAVQARAMLAGEVPRPLATAAVWAAMRRLRSVSMPSAQDRAAGTGEAARRPIRVSSPGAVGS